MKSQLNSSPLIIIIPNEPSLKAGVYYFLLSLVFLISSCSSITVPTRARKNSLHSGNYEEMSPKDYSDYLAHQKGPFLSTPGVKVFKQDESTSRYLTALLKEIIFKNETFFTNLKTARITILDTESPLHFSLPKGEVFISKGLIDRYLKHESMLVSILSYELVRSENLLYPKQLIIPVGYVTLERILSLNRLGLDEKMEVHKWAHHVTIRSGYDGEYYLSWLQTQNRNTADFLLQVGDANMITREESLFKAFLIKSADEEKLNTKKNSSKSFYTFLNRVRDGIL